MSGRSNRTPTHIDKVDAWHTVYLEQCIVHWNDQTSAIKYDRNTGRKPGSRAQNWYLQLGYQKDDHSQHLQFRAVDSNNTLVAKVDFPNSKSSISIDVNLFEVTFTIQIKEIGPNDSIVSQLILILPPTNSTPESRLFLQTGCQVGHEDGVQPVPVCTPKPASMTCPTPVSYYCID
jgi:hypothetical protein